MSNIDVSFLISSAFKPYEQYGKRVIDSIHNIDSTGFSYEILYSSPEEPPEKGIIWHKDNIMRGSIPAYNELIKISKANYISVLTDDHLLSPNFFDVLYFLESSLFANREYKICTLASGIVGQNIQSPPVRLPEVFGPGWKNDWRKLPPYLVMRFPVASMETIKNNLDGYIFHPCFCRHFADNYLGLYLGDNDEPGLECPKATMAVMPESIEFQKSLDVYLPYFKDMGPKFYDESYLECIKLLKEYKKGMKYSVQIDDEVLK